MGLMENFLWFGVIIPVYGCAQLFTIFFCSGYVYWIESKSDTLAPSNQVHQSNPPHKAFDTKISRLQKRSVLLLSISSFFGCVAAAGVLSLHMYGLTHTPFTDPIWCEKVIPKIYSVSYVLSNVFLYQFLNTRSELVKTAAENSKNFQRLRQLAKLLANCAPVAALVSFFLWGGKLVEVEGKKYCIDSPSWENSLFFLLVAIFVSILYLILFIWPLRAHISQIKELRSESSQAILAVVRRNFILSAIAMCSTMISTIFFVATTLAHHDDPPSFIYTLTIGVIDLCINSICISLMTNAWIPKKLKAIKFHKSDSDQLSNQTGTVSPLMNEDAVLTRMKSTPSLSMNTNVKSVASEFQSEKE